MVIEFYNLQYTIYKADNAQAIQSLFAIQDKASQDTYAQENQATALENRNKVKDTDKTEGTEVHEDQEGGQEYQLEFKKPKEETKEEAKERKEKEQSVNGKGTIIDYTV